MKNRSILARMTAKVKAVKAKKKVDKPVVETPEKAVTKKISATNPETGKEELSFESIDKAVEKGFNEPNILRALKGGTKYKGHLWAYSE